MTSRLPVLLMARRMALVASRRVRPTPALFSLASKIALSTQADKAGDYSNLHEQMEAVEHMFETANQDSLDPEHKKQIQELKAMLAQVKHSYAVDAPDGEPDAHLVEELSDAQAILEASAAAKHREELRDHLVNIQAMFQRGTAEERKEELQERLDDLKVLMEKTQAFAVDSPDGEVDGHIQEEMEEIKHIIDDAAVLEDKKKIEYQHKMDDAVRKDRARDPEHDW
jgi:hypothetical protein